MPVPYIILLLLYVIGFVGGCCLHGEEFGERHAGGIVLFQTLKIGLLMGGGFFNHIAWPQIWIISLSCIDLIMGIVTDGQPIGKHSVLSTLIGYTITFFPLYFGGFFGGMQ
jgi:hypothetical protein